MIWLYFAHRQLHALVIHSSLRDRQHSIIHFFIFLMRYILLLASVLTLSVSAHSWVAKFYQYTLKTKTQVCAIDIAILTSGQVKVEKICYNLK